MRWNQKGHVLLKHAGSLLFPYAGGSSNTSKYVLENVGEPNYIGTPMEDATHLVRNSSLYKEFLAERAEILRHKWIESEKAGFDIGFDRALIDWIVKYRSPCYEQRQLFRPHPLDVV